MLISNFWRNRDRTAPNASITVPTAITDLPLCFHHSCSGCTEETEAFNKKVSVFYRQYTARTAARSCSLFPCHWFQHSLFPCHWFFVLFHPLTTLLSGKQADSWSNMIKSFPADTQNQTITKNNILWSQPFWVKNKVCTAAPWEMYCF